jgi:hypothetical protein
MWHVTCIFLFDPLESFGRRDGIIHHPFHPAFLLLETEPKVASLALNSSESVKLHTLTSIIWINAPNLSPNSPFRCRWRNLLHLRFDIITQHSLDSAHPIISWLVSVRRPIIFSTNFSSAPNDFSASSSSAPHDF